MSRNAARAFITGGFGVALGFGLEVDLGAALAVLLGDPAAGLTVVSAGGLEPMGDGPVSAPGADGEQATVTTRSESPAAARRIPRHYVATEAALSRASERPSGSQDVTAARIDSLCPAAIVAACTPERSSSYVSVSAEPSSSPTRSLVCQPAAGVFCWRGTCGVQA